MNEERADPIENAEVAWQFREMADLLDLQGENRFRVRAYRNAARSIEQYPGSVAELAARGTEALNEIPAVGTVLARKIVEISETGIFTALAEARTRVPSGMRELTRLRGIGPERARSLASTLGIRSLPDLERALADGTIRKVRGFGPESEARLREALAIQRSEASRTRRAVVEQFAVAMLQYLREAKEVDRAEIVGSYRRLQDAVRDLDLLACSDRPEVVVDRLVGYPGVGEILSRGQAHATVRLKNDIEIELRVVRPEQMGAASYYYTGSREHIDAVAAAAREHGLVLDERGVHRGHRVVAAATEEEVLTAVGLRWIPPELRENRGEIEAARNGTLPVLVELGDLRGDLQSHTTDSDGRADLETMARAAHELGYEYFAVTDHSPALKMLGGLDRDEYLRQAERIDALNASFQGFTLLKGAEVDILQDGSLDLDDDTLDRFDLVVASIHSRFDLPAPEQTRRIVRALQHRSVDVLGHPTGRILGRRPGIQFDLDQILEAAADHGVMIEVNAQPDRLDFDDLKARAAIDRGIRIVISTDAHSPHELRYMRWGVDQARRAWATAASVANTRSLADLRPLLHRHR